MSRVKDIRIKPISSLDANRIIKKLHYSGKVVPNSQVHFGIFLDGKCGGAIQYGPSFDKSKVIDLVEDTKWNEFIELNRMATAEWMPHNSESRALSVSLKILKKEYSHLKWVISFADATQSGDGSIYRATNFILTSIKENKSMIQLPNGDVVAKMTYTKGKHIRKNSGKASPPEEAKELDGYQLRYIYFLDKSYRDNLTVKEIPYEKIDEVGAGMYKGEKITYKERNQQ